jgi:phage/plasmid-associated DNA primase
VGLVDKLRGEKAEILRWMVEGWVGWAAGGLPACKAIHDATEEYLDNADVFGRWLRECLVAAAGAVAVRDRVYVGEAFASWEAFRDDNKSHATGPHSDWELGVKLREAGYTITKGQKGKYIEGVSLKTNPKKVF